MEGRERQKYPSMTWSSGFNF